MRTRSLITKPLICTLVALQAATTYATDLHNSSYQETRKLIADLKTSCRSTGIERFLRIDQSQSRSCMLDLVEQKRRLLRTQSETAQFDDIDFRKKLSILEAVELRIGQNEYRTIEKRAAQSDSGQSTRSIDVLNGYTVRQYP